MNARKHPRTMQEAFGPYTDNRIAEVDPPFDFCDRVVIGAAVAVLAGVVVAHFLGVL